MNKNNAYTGLEIAVIGMAGRFPGAKNIEEYWQNLLNGRETISFFTDEELLGAGVEPGELADPNYVKAYGYLEGIEYFDAAFFGYTGTEAVLMDPQMRIFLECAWEGLEDAGYDPSTYSGLIGVYTGAGTQYEWATRAFLGDEITALGFFAGQLLVNRDLMSGWVSYKLDLKGPSITMITACSTSLVTIHCACQALLNGECDIALAGSASIGALTKSGYTYAEGLPASPDGHVRAFDAGPHGVVGGNGAALVILKPLADARQDRDHIYAVIKGSAINNDGINKVGFTAPSVEGQARAIKAALSMAEVEPETIGYVETHGTATELGDPIEIQGLTLAFNTTKRQYCPIGSVKTNIGHIDTAAGAAGLIKAALCIYHRLIPPSLNYQKPNPGIDFEKTPFYVNVKLSEWKDQNNPLRAGVSSFGLGGTNAHAILQEAPARETSLPDQCRPFQLFLLSAGTRAALDRNTGNLGHYLEKNPGINLADVAYTLQTGRKHFPYRRMSVCSTWEQAARDFSPAGFESLETHQVPGKKHPLVFIFSGQGTQYENMALGLYQQEPYFREEMDRGFQILENLYGFSIKEILYPPPAARIPGDSKKLYDFRYGGAISMLLEYSLARLLIKWGLKPEALIGHSFGEYTAACLSGVFSLADALKLAFLRGQLIFDMPEGVMMGVPLSEDRLKNMTGHNIYIAAVNAPDYCVVSGAPAAVEQFKKELEAKGLECYILQVPRAGHSPLMAPYIGQLTTQFEQIQFNAPGIPYISGVTGDWIQASDANSPSYWGRHMSETTRFHDGISRLFQELDPIFIQVGADRQLPLYINSHPSKKESNLALNLVRRPKYDIHDTAYLLNALGQLWLYGVPIDWKSFYAHENRFRISLPAYSFERTYYPFPGNAGKIVPHNIAFQNIAAPHTAGRIGTTGTTVTTLQPGSSEKEDKSKRKRPHLRTPYVRAEELLAQQLVDLFQSFFGIEPVGILDDFYELGGDSLRAVQLTGLIKKTIAGMTVSVRQLLYYQNIHDLCAGLRREGGIADSEKPAAPPPAANETNAAKVEKEPVLKNEISAAEQNLIAEKLAEAGLFTALLKKSPWTLMYEISPVQASWLQDDPGRMSTNFIYYYHDFKHPTGYEKIKNMLKIIIQKNALLRSVIIRENGKYYLREYDATDTIDTIDNIQLPLIDLSAYTVTCRGGIIEWMTAYINRPVEVIDRILFRAWVLKIDSNSFRLIMQFNHLIFDGACFNILDTQFQALDYGRENIRKKNFPVSEYYDYVRFMKAQNYGQLDLEKYINIREYIKANRVILEKYKIALVQSETFEIEFSLAGDGSKGYYNEIAFLAFAKLIGAIFGENQIPVEYVTNGRFYRDGDFNHIIGDFHDIVPVLVSLSGTPQAEIERFIAYNRFIKENQLNFMNYIHKSSLAGLDIKKETWRSPFTYNALIGSYDSIPKPLAGETPVGLSGTLPHFEIVLLEDFSAGKIWITITQNIGLSVKEEFIKNYKDIINVAV